MSGVPSFLRFYAEGLILNNFSVVKDIRADYYTHRNEGFYLKFISVATDMHLLFFISQATYPVP